MVCCAQDPVGIMVKFLCEPVAALSDLGAKKKWKSWNTIVIQVDSGESRISADAAEPESESRPAWLQLGKSSETSVARLLGVDFHDVLIPQYMFRSHALARKFACGPPDARIAVSLSQVAVDTARQFLDSGAFADHKWMI